MTLAVQPLAASVATGPGARLRGDERLAAHDARHRVVMNTAAIIGTAQRGSVKAVQAATAHAQRDSPAAVPVDHGSHRAATAFAVQPLHIKG